MSTITNKDIALSIIGFLKQSISNKEISEDYIESMDVAIDCIADAYEVDKETSSTIASKFNGKSLSELLKSVSISAPVESITEDIKEKADALKIEGNKAMQLRDFQTAIDKYTAAIELDPLNEIYLSNRAAAYSSNAQHAKAVIDAEKAIEINKDYGKAYSRLGLAKYALGDAKGSMEAYEQGLKVEGDKKSDAMRKGYETAKKRYEEEQSSVESTREAPTSDAGAGAGAGAGGLPDLSSMFGGAGGAGGAGGMPSFADMMSNPQIMQAAQEMMSNPDAMRNLFNNPAVRSMAESMGLGGENAPDLSNIMNNPMFSQFMGGNRDNNNNNSN